jgi:D-glycero-D-manno-heptose 1,7-bisphosphate phosphatase
MSNSVFATDPRCQTDRPVRAVLFDRDGTLVHDVPYNGNPDRVRAVDGAAAAVARLRRNCVFAGVITNQSGIARGLLSESEAQAVNRRVSELVGPFDCMQMCAHGPEDGCACRKPAPGMVYEACRFLQTSPVYCAVIGDIGADIAAAEAAGATGVLVPTAVTLQSEIDEAMWVARDLAHALDMLGVPA